MKKLLSFVLLPVLLSACGPQKPDPQDVAFLAAGEQAIIGSYALHSTNLSQERVCTLAVLTNHTFAISNLPIAGFSRTISATGSWSLDVYRVFNAQRYKVSFTGVTNIIRVGFPNADLPEGTKPTALSIWYVEGQGPPLDYLFRQVQPTPEPPPLR